MGTPKRASKREGNGAPARVGLLANGASGPWSIDVDEGPARFFAQVEGPSVALYFEISSPVVIAQTLDFLQPRRAGAAEGDATLPIGTFGRASIHLIRDDEYPDRCFLTVGDSDSPGLRLTLTGEEVGHLREALRQIKDELTEDGLLSNS